MAVVNEWGLHARPCAAIATEAAKHKCEIEITKEDRSASANSVAALLMLEAHSGTELQVSARGPDAEEALEAVAAIIAGGFGEQHLVIRGTGNDCGVAVGRAHVLAQDHKDIPHQKIAKASVAAEQKRYRQAIGQARKQFERLDRTNLPHEEIAQFQQLLLAMLADGIFSKDPLRIIADEQVNAEWALKLAVDPILAAFAASPEELLRSRRSDYSQMMMRIIAQLSQAKTKRRHHGSRHVLVAHEMGPAEVVETVRAGYEGFVAAEGSKTSHATILSHSLLMPAVVGIGTESFSEISEKDLLVIDAVEGLLHVNPPEDVLQHHRRQARRQNEARRRTRKLPQRPPPRTVTRDGHRIHLLANLEVPEEIPHARREGAEGVGLFRTESLFLEDDRLPGADDQYQIYTRVLQDMGGLPVTFRTLDLGYDKQTGKMSAYASAMGVRGIRYCLREPALFKAQLQALLRAAAHGPLQIMLPMVGSAAEISETRQLLEEARSEIGMVSKQLPELGAMIEIPATVHLIESMAAVADFFSIGSNDLVSYLLAIDRREEQLSTQDMPCHPAVTSTLKDIIDRCRRAKAPLTLCGELASDPRFARMLTTLGLDSLSMAPDRIRPMRDCLRRTNLTKIHALAAKAAASPTGEEVAAVLDRLAA